MQETAEPIATSQFSRIGPEAFKTSADSAVKIQRKAIINAKSSPECEPEAASGVCPCCGAALQNQRLRIDLNTNTFLYKTHSIPLRAREAELLSVLIDRSPGVVAHDTIVRCVWGQNEPGDPEKNIQVTICRLRKKLKGTGASILNVFEVGYRFVVDGEAS